MLFRLAMRPRTFNCKSHRAMGLGLLMVVAITILPGCNVFSLRNQLKELETENNRLLSEFRAERQRRETAEQAAKQMETRLAESEKLLARQLQDNIPGRLSSSQGQSSRTDFQSPFATPWSPPGAFPGPLTAPPGNSDGLKPQDDFRWQRRK